MNETQKQELTKKLLEIAKKEIGITYRKSDAPLSTGCSKIGGIPDVSKGFEWPWFSGKAYGEEENVSRPLSFLAQINLRDVANLDEEGVLPKTGVLSFFYELETMSWGFTPEDKGSARVFYFPEEEELAAAECPADLDESLILPELALDFQSQISLPDYGCFEADMAFEYEDYEICSTECGYTYDGWGERTKLLGYPDVIQNPMEEECERVIRGYSCGSPEDYAKIPEAEKADIKEKASNWMLLFQMGTVSAEEYELMFGDCGHIYFWIKKSDLLSRNFEDAWLILQCG